MKLPCDEGIRWDRVARARAEIAAGTLETPERVAATVEQLMDVLFPQNC